MDYVGLGRRFQVRPITLLWGAETALVRAWWGHSRNDSASGSGFQCNPADYTGQSMIAVIIFDLDGTLTKPCLDFDTIRAEVGVTGPILEAMERMEEPRRSEVKAALLRHERRAAQAAVLHEGAREVLASCVQRGYRVAILTRNSRASAECVMDKFDLSVDALRTRDDGAIKPSPEPVLSICRELGADPAKSWMVGDYLFDIQSGRAAGTRTVLMLGDRERPDFADQADFVIARLPELLSLLDGNEAGHDRVD